MALGLIETPEVSQNSTKKIRGGLPLSRRHAWPFSAFSRDLRAGTAGTAFAVGGRHQFVKDAALRARVERVASGTQYLQFPF